MIEKKYIFYPSKFINEKNSIVFGKHKFKIETRLNYFL